jgi:hypothetical protein
MESLTLQQLFGVGAFQDASTLIIQKSNLVRLTNLSTNNTAESLLVAILITALEKFEGELTDPAENSVTDPADNAITYSNKNLYELLELIRWKSYYKQKSNEFYLTDSIIIHQFTPNAD